jgi:glycyl-tRNA synthetase
MSIPRALAPNKLAFLPLLKKDGLPEYARKIMKEFVHEINIIYDEKDAIGRRYRRQDAVGTPYCITIDHQTLEDDTFTIRDRDSMEQTRINLSQLSKIVDSELTIKSLLKKLDN